MPLGASYRLAQLLRKLGDKLAGKVLLTISVGRLLNENADRLLPKKTRQLGGVVDVGIAIAHDPPRNQEVRLGGVQNGVLAEEELLQ